MQYADILFQYKNLDAARPLAEEVYHNAGDNKQLAGAAKRLLIRVYEGLGILDDVGLEVPPPGKDDEEKDGEEEKKEEEKKAE